MDILPFLLSLQLWKSFENDDDAATGRRNNTANDAGPRRNICVDLCEGRRSQKSQADAQTD
jgi:hypothetical protein